MDTANQLRIFLVCVGAGLLAGVIYEPFGLLARACGCNGKRRKGLSVAIDMLFFAVLSILSIWLSYAFRFPDFRVYIWIGYAVGGIIYFKFLHKTIAFFENICYNKISRWWKKAKKRRKSLKKLENKGL